MVSGMLLFFSNNLARHPHPALIPYILISLLVCQSFPLSDPAFVRCFAVMALFLLWRVSCCIFRNPYALYGVSKNCNA